MTTKQKKKKRARRKRKAESWANLAKAFNKK